MSEVENIGQTAVAISDHPSDQKCAENSLAGHIDDAEKSEHSPSDPVSSTEGSKNCVEDGRLSANVKFESKGDTTVSANGTSKEHQESQSGDTGSQSKSEEEKSAENKRAEATNLGDVLCKEISSLTVEKGEKAEGNAEASQQGQPAQNQAAEKIEQEVSVESSNENKEVTAQANTQSAEQSSSSPPDDAVANNKGDTYSKSDGQSAASKHIKKEEELDSADDEYEEDEDEEEGVDDEGNDEEEELDEDEIKSSPAYIPKHGNFYMHDVRGSTNNADGAVPDAEDKHPEEEEEPEKGAAGRSRTGGIRSRADRKWEHDLFDDRQQKPKTPKELARKYGRNMPQSESKEGVEAEEEEPQQPTRRRSTIGSTQSSNRRHNQDDQSLRKPAVRIQGERERRAPLPRNQPLRDNHRDTRSATNRRVPAYRDASPIHQKERREHYQNTPVQNHQAGGGRRTTFVSSTHRLPHNGGGAPPNRRHNYQDEDRGRYEHGRMQAGNYRDDKLSHRNYPPQQQRYVRSEQQQGRESSIQHQPVARYHQEEQEGRGSTRGGGGRRYTSQRSAASQRNATASGNAYNNSDNSAQKAQQHQVVEDEWSRAGPQDWGDSNNDGWSNNDYETATVGKSSFTTIHNQPPAAGSQQPPQGYYAQSQPHNPHAQRFQPRYSQPMRTDIPPPNYSRGGRAANYAAHPVAPRGETGPYPYPRQPTDVVYFDPPQGAPAPPISDLRGSHQQQQQQQPTRERRRLNIAPPSQQFSN